jgi:hypothetical protein
MARRDIEQVYVGLYLDAVVSFELFLEKLFIGILSGRIISPRKTVKPKVKFTSERVVKPIVFSGKKFADWLPYGRTQERARLYFYRGLPFSSLKKEDIEKIDNIMVIRNVFAHRSSHSLKRFKNDIIGDTPLNRVERTPAGYLRVLFRQNPDQTRFEEKIYSLGNIANKLSK